MPIQASPLDVNQTLDLAQSQRSAGDLSASLAAVNKVLSLQPRNMAALLMKADLLVDLGDARGAVSFYSATVRLAAANPAASPDQAEVRRAADMVKKYAREFEEHIRSQLAEQGFHQSNLPPRFAKAIDILVGKKQAYPQAPRHLFFPELAPIQFFDRASFPFLDKVEAAFHDIRSELQGAIEEATGFEPYVKSAANRPPSSQRGLADNSAWSAFFLVKEGQLTEGGLKCPKTLAALEGAPQANIPNHSPMVLFSKLTPGTRIPPHTGMINTRLVCHLPLIVPTGCHFRVGNDTRTWREGEAWVFDDTIEHEAWNQASEDRTILIFDIWRPDLSEEEKAAFTALCVAVDGYSGKQDWE